MTTPAKPDVQAIRERIQKVANRFDACASDDNHEAVKTCGEVLDLLAYVEHLESALARVTEENERLKEVIESEEGDRTLLVLLKATREQLARVTLERDEAAGLLRRAVEEIDGLAGQQAMPDYSYEETEDAIKAYLSRLDQPESPEQER